MSSQLQSKQFSEHARKLRKLVSRLKGDQYVANVSVEVLQEIFMVYSGIVNEAMELSASLSRYETAMREALNALVEPLDVRLADQYFLEAAISRSFSGASILRAALSDQPAEEPAGSKLEAKCERRVLEARIDEHAKTCGDCNETNLCDDMLELRRWLAVLDAQPSTPEPKGKRK